MPSHDRQTPRKTDKGVGFARVRVKNGGNGGMALRLADRVYGEVDLPPLVAALASTPEFLRLDRIRQLGACALVYPSATHTRREHSIGVSHLSGVAARHLQSMYPLLVDPDDILCVQIAGLVHDLGHGPFSHTFEDYMGGAWCHETMSTSMLHHVAAQHKDLFEKYFHVYAFEKNIAFIALLVIGFDDTTKWPTEDTGRHAQKRFLADIVHSRGTGVDTDKLDYLCRDAMTVFGTTNALCVSRIVSAMRVTEQSKLAFSESVAFDLVEIFRLRSRLHHEVYQHRDVLVAEGVIKKMMAAYDERNSLCKVVEDPVLFARLTDSCILGASADVDFRRPWCRYVPVAVSLHTLPLCSTCSSETAIQHKSYTQCGTTTATRTGSGTERLLQAIGCTIGSADIAKQVSAIAGVEVDVHIVDIACGTAVDIEDPHGKKWKGFDPLCSVTFVSKDERTTLRMNPESFFIPKTRHVRIVHTCLPVSATGAEISHATSAIREWGVGKGVEITEEVVGECMSHL